MAVGLLVIGLVLVVAGADLLVKGASQLATRLGIPPLMIGLTVVAFGTSTPELAVSLRSSWIGQPELALGNVLGSNVFNILFVLGLSAVITPLIVSRQLVHFDVPVMIGISILVWLLGWDGQLSRWDGGLLLIILGIYLVLLLRLGRGEELMEEVETAGSEGPDPEAAAQAVPSTLIHGLQIGAGVGLLVLGSRGLVQGAVGIAMALGLSELVIGLTVVAIGTSTPEGVTSIVACLRGQPDLSVGNMIGSNILNLLAVLGLTSLITPEGMVVPLEAQRFDIPVIIAVALACLPIFATGHRIARWEGLVFLAYQVLYLIYQVLSESQKQMLPVFHQITAVFVVPLTILTLVVLIYRWVWVREESEPQHRSSSS